MSDRPVYSTGGGDQRKEKKKAKGGAGFRRGSGPCHVRKEKKGRGGKTVTIIENVPLEKAEAKKLLKDLQGRFACGGKLAESWLELQGDFGDELRSYLKGHEIFK